MLSDYVRYLMSMADYSKDENNIIVGVVPTYQGFYAQGDSREDARQNFFYMIVKNYRCDFYQLS